MNQILILILKSNIKKQNIILASNYIKNQYQMKGILNKIYFILLQQKKIFYIAIII